MTPISDALLITYTLRTQPLENKVMRRASLISVMTTTIFYMLYGVSGYAAFGNRTPGNMLTGFEFCKPFWLIDVANICIVVHLVGAYQVFCQPIFGFVEKSCSLKWPEIHFIAIEHGINVPFYGIYHVNFFRLTWRTGYVILTFLLDILFPYFNNFLAFIGAVSFYPLTAYFPIEMHIAQQNVPRYSRKWVWLKLLSLVCLIGSVLAAIGSIVGLAHDVKGSKPFH